MKENQTKRHMFLLLGMLYCMVLSSNISHSIPFSLNMSQQSSGVRIADVSDYGSDLFVSWGGDDSDYGTGIAIDATGNIYITGITSSYGSGQNDIFIAKFNSSGVQQWNATWGATTNEIAGDITLDNSGNIYIAGKSLTDAVILKFNNSGALKMILTWGGSLQDYAYDIAVDTSGNIYITGETRSFGAGYGDAFVTKYDAAGIQQWNATWGGINEETAYGIALDLVGNVYITGTAENYDRDDYDAFIVKFNSSGVQQWNATWGGSSHDSGYDIASNAIGYVYITGETWSFGAGRCDAFIAKYDYFGTQHWNTTCGDYENECAHGIVIDDEENIYIAGSTGSCTQGNTDAFVVKYDSSGIQQGKNTWGGGESDSAYDIILDEEGNVLITGATWSFGAGRNDAFIVKNPNQVNRCNDEIISGYNLIILIGFLGLSLIVLSKKYYGKE